MLQFFVTFSEMCSQIDLGHRAKKEVVLLRDKVKERESLVAATTEFARAEAWKLREELESSYWLLDDA